MTENLRIGVLGATYIGLPTGTHARWALAASAAGKQVSREKPFASSASEICEIADGAAAQAIAALSTTAGLEPGA